MIDSGFLALRDRAFEVLAAHGPLDEPELLAYVYGGVPPRTLRERLIAPLLQDARLERRADGSWVRRADRAPFESVSDELTVLALATTGPTPGRSRIVHLAALQLAGDAVSARFTASFHPGRRVPGYVARRLGLDVSVLDGLPPIESAFDSFVEFLGARPVLAQDAALTWAFVEAEARRLGNVLRPTVLVDVNEVAADVLAKEIGKPTLARIANSLGVAFGRIEQPDEEARVLALVSPRLLREVRARGRHVPMTAGVQAHSPVLRQGATARALPDQPGIYVLRDAEQGALYVGKARRLRSRMQSYVHRPLGATRRLQGLVGNVHVVDSASCATDLEALVLEDREIRRLQPRFNTVRRQREPRLWVRLPPPPGRRRAPRRLELCSDPRAAGDVLGPFRNEALAEHARDLARAVFGLDALRRHDVQHYEPRLLAAWQFLNGDNRDAALELLHERQRRAVASGDTLQMRAAERLLSSMPAYDPRTALWPADPRHAVVAVIRPSPEGIEGLLLERAVLVSSALVGDEDIDRFVADLLQQSAPRTAAEDMAVVLRWLGAQRPAAHVVFLPADRVRAGDLIADAAWSVLAAREP